jgi:hypothetical protein
LRLSHYSRLELLVTKGWGGCLSSNASLRFQDEAIHNLKEYQKTIAVINDIKSKLTGFSITVHINQPKINMILAYVL